MGVQRLLREVLQPSQNAGLGRTTPALPSRTVQLCDTQLLIEVEEFGSGGPVFINVHENETTSVDATRVVLKNGKGRIVRLRAKGRRNVVFWRGVRPFGFDPNRIFTEAGMRQTLSHFSSLTPPALDALHRLRTELLHLLPTDSGQPVVALHNNSGTDYSISNYRPGGRLENDAAALSIAVRERPEDFFIVTDMRWFKHLAQSNFNVVLQSPNVHDDGSLSVWFQSKGLCYINVEAQHGRQAEQEEMIRAVLYGLATA